jgi:hypothetical protein
MSYFYKDLQRVRHNMDTDSLAQVQEETTLTKIRVNLKSKNVKLWEPPYLEPGMQWFYFQKPSNQTPNVASKE